MPTVLSMRHTGLVVRDLPHSIDFYTRVLGLKAPVVVVEQGAFLEHVLACPGVAVTTAKFQAMQGECMLELLYFASPESTPSSPEEYPFWTDTCGLYCERTRCLAGRSGQGRGQ